MKKVITFKEADKKVYEIIKEIKGQGWNAGGTLRMLLRCGTTKITEEQAKVACNYADRGNEAYTQIFEALSPRNDIKLEETAKELTLAEAMKAMNEDRQSVKIVTGSGEKLVRRFTDFEDLEDIGIADFDDLHTAKFFTVAK
ncbi:hypothetical protein CN613_25430 [Bacillus pseudomycoides]|uniref:Uncharacterized protein n=1 Tax=Bacillus pseudomycoides TaxID=64104 RepID=A0A2A8BYT7_9BACI|nr:hypothetical protein [Bacillus pseudomycoides]PEM65290.1 hypothetical protein CN613_25430 [Bacillus pseudomycoides]